MQTKCEERRRAGGTSVIYRVLIASYVKPRNKIQRIYKVKAGGTLNPAGHVMHQQFNIQQLYVLPTLYLCVLYLSENRQRLVPLTA